MLLSRPSGRFQCPGATFDAPIDVTIATIPPLSSGAFHSQLETTTAYPPLNTTCRGEFWYTALPDDGYIIDTSPHLSTLCNGWSSCIAVLSNKPSAYPIVEAQDGNARYRAIHGHPRRVQGTGGGFPRATREPRNLRELRRRRSSGPFAVGSCLPLLLKNKVNVSDSELGVAEVLGLHVHSDAHL